MKPLSIFYMILFTGIFAVSCTTTRPINDDNVYIMKTSALPVGENLTDETSYATYKHRQETDNPTAGYIDPKAQSTLDRDPRANNNSMFYAGLYQGSYNAFWGMHRSGFFYGPGLPRLVCAWNYGYNNTYPMYYSMYGYNNWNNNYYGISNYYGNSGFYENSGFYGNTGLYSPNSYYSNNFYNSENWNNANISRPSGNYVSGPRVTSSGYYSGNNRGGAAQLKSQVANSNSYVRPGARGTNTSSQSETETYKRDNSNGGSSTIGRTTYTRTSNSQALGGATRTYEDSRRAAVTSGSGSSRISIGSGSTNTRSNYSGGGSIGGSRGGSSGSGSSSGSSGGRSGGRGN